MILNECETWVLALSYSGSLQLCARQSERVHVHLLIVGVPVVRFGLAKEFEHLILEFSGGFRLRNIPANEGAGSHAEQNEYQHAHDSVLLLVWWVSVREAEHGRGAKAEAMMPPTHRPLVLSRERF
ncbi:hypothetical protein [Thiorhodovibrio winogradskyi]|uniref:hypothetical protein n=1 Tax=Thiorhodovibrio winogradskyi TaxID=77007 RepID=UPI002E2CF4D7|nr:hypothetical protein [Thiorhodovibrio winogradskyi]